MWSESGPGVWLPVCFSNLRAGVAVSVCSSCCGFRGLVLGVQVVGVVVKQLVGHGSYDDRRLEHVDVRLGARLSAWAPGLLVVNATRCSSVASCRYGVVADRMLPMLLPVSRLRLWLWRSFHCGDSGVCMCIQVCVGLLQVECRLRMWHARL